MTRPVSDFLPGPFPTPAQRAEGATLLASLLARPRGGTPAAVEPGAQPKPLPRSPWTLSRDDLRRFDMPAMPTPWALPNPPPSGPSYFGVDPPPQRTLPESLQEDVRRFDARVERERLLTLQKLARAQMTGRPPRARK